MAEASDPMRLAPRPFDVGDAEMVRVVFDESWKTIHWIMQQAFAESAQSPYPSSALRETHDEVRHSLQDQGALLVENSSGAPIASVRFHSFASHRDIARAFFRSVPLEDGGSGGVLTFLRLSVLPAYRNQGIGGALIIELERIARNLKCVALCCTARSQYPDNRPWYKGKGFNITHYSPAYGMAEMRTHLQKPLTD